jgi:hypothetical protein
LEAERRGGAFMNGRTEINRVPIRANQQEPGAWPGSEFGVVNFVISAGRACRSRACGRPDAAVPAQAAACSAAPAFGFHCSLQYPFAKDLKTIF